MDRGSQFLSDLVLNRTYADVKTDGYKETQEEVVQRVLAHHYEKFPKLAQQIKEICEEPLLKKQVVPAMRWMQFAGVGIKRSNIRGFNCAYTTIESFQDFAEIFYILMNGTGMGFSVRKNHIKNIPVIQEGYEDTYTISDSKEGWSDSVKLLLCNPQLQFDYSLIRPKGAKLSTGGTASGPEALKVLHTNMRAVLDKAIGRQLSSIECHDIVCQIADGVVVGGVRRAALISLFDPDDEEMLGCKQGAWWETAPWRGRSNNSAVINRNDINAGFLFEKTMEACYASGSGEPGIYWSNNDDWGTNPCVEIALKSKQMCNLSEVNLSACANLEEVTRAVHAAALLGTLQASYVDFPYIDSRWSANCRAEALLGVSITGQAQGWEFLAHGPTTKYLASIAVAVNKKWAKKIYIKPSNRITCTKPSGTASAYFGSTSGIHAAHAPYYLRRVRIDCDHPVAAYLEKNLPSQFLEKDVFNPSNWVVSIPIKMKNSILREEETAVQLMNRSKHMAQNWIAPGHIEGENGHNISMTVSFKEEEKEAVKTWMWDNREFYNGISLLPFDGGTYQQAPFETITEAEYKKLIKEFPDIDLSQVKYVDTVDDRQSEAACSGGSCEWGV